MTCRSSSEFAKPTDLLLPPFEIRGQMSTQTPLETIHEVILRDVIRGRLTEEDALVWMVLLHTHEIHLHSGVVADPSGNVQTHMEAVLPAETQRGAATLIAALWPDREDKRTDYVHWYWEYNMKTPYEDVSDIPKEMHGRLQELRAGLEQDPRVIKVVPEN
jgi:hypothetical protein